MIRASHTITGAIAVAVVATSIIGTPSTPRIKHTNSFTHIVPSILIAQPVVFQGGEVEVADTKYNDVVYTVSKVLADTATISESPVFTFTRGAFADSVTVTEAKIILTTSIVDTNLSTSEVDTDPVTISEAAIITISPSYSDGFGLGEAYVSAFTKVDTDSTTPSEAAVFTPTKVDTDSTTPSEAAVLAFTKVDTDSTTPSEVFSVTYLYTDTSDRTINGHYFNETPIR